MRYSIFSFIFFLSIVLLAQSPEDIARRLGESFQNRSSFQLIEKPLDHVQQGILVMRPTRMDALDVETIVSVSESGEMYLNASANPGRMKIWRDSELVFDGRTKTVGAPPSVDQHVFKSEVHYPLPVFSGDYQIRFEYYPEGESSTIFLWVSNEKGIVQQEMSYRSDWDFADQLYKFKSRTSADELDWEFPSELPTALQLKSELNDWNYATGMVLDAMWKASEHFSSVDFRSFVKEHLNFYADNLNRIVEGTQNKDAIFKPFQRYFRYQQFDDFGPQTVPFLNLEETDANKKFVSKGLSKLLYKATRLSDGSYARTKPDSLSMWSEDLYMSTVLLCRAYQQSQSPKYLQEAIKQTILYNRHLKDRMSRIYTHGFFAENVERSASKWARANGFVLWANVELLKVMPLDHPELESILRIYRSNASSMRELQSLDGRWRQVLNKDSSYLETSASALFVAAFAEGLSNDWLFNKAEFRQSTVKGWVALTEQIDEVGNVVGISPDTPILYSDEEYEKLKPLENHPVGLAAMLYAAIAMDRFQGSSK